MNDTVKIYKCYTIDSITGEELQGDDWLTADEIKARNNDPMFNRDFQCIKMGEGHPDHEKPRSTYA